MVRGVTEAARDGLASGRLGSTKNIGLHLVAEGQFENLSEACRAGLRRLAEDAKVIQQLAALGEKGMASGVYDAFHMDGFVEEARVRRRGSPGRTQAGITRAALILRWALGA